MGDVWRDLIYSVRRMRRDWMVSAIAALSLGAALGGNATVFSLVDTFLFRPLPYDAPERLVLVGERRSDAPAMQGNLGTSLPTWADLAERSRTIDDWAAFENRVFPVRGSERAEAVPGAAVTPRFFELLGAVPARGRSLGAADAEGGGVDAVMLSHGYAETRFGAGADPLGEVLIVGGRARTVVGVLQPDFQFFFPRLDVWVPLATPPSEAPRDDRRYMVVGRMAVGVSTETVRAEMTALASALERDAPDHQAGWTLDTYNLRHDIPTQQSRILFGLLQGCVGLVLLIACANVANLLLARGQERGREIALRAALGADRSRIVRQLLTEVAVLVAAGGLVGVGVAWTGIRWISGAFAGILPPGYELRLDGRVLAVTAALSVAAIVVAGLVPAWRASGRARATALREGRGAGVGRGRKTVSRVLVVAEIALSFVALGGGSLLVRSFLSLQGGDPGFEGDRILTASLAAPAEDVATPEARTALHGRILERLRGLPGVEAATLADAVPRTFGPAGDSLRVVGEVDDGTPAPRVTRIGAAEGYVEAVGLALLRGRFFEASDGPDDPPVAVVSASLARSRWGDEGPLGRRVVVGGRERAVVGVVSDVAPLIRAAGTTAEAVYLPVAQSDGGGSTLLVRTTGRPEAAAESVRDALRKLDPDLALANVSSYDDVMDQAFTGVRVFSSILGGFGVVALILASLGTWGVLAFTVAQRRREIGIRMAVGAPRNRVVWSFFRQGLWLGLAGLALGLVLTLPLVGLLSSLVASFSTVQPLTLAGIGGLLLAVTLLASWMPARGAASLDPVRALRTE